MRQSVFSIGTAELIKLKKRKHTRGGGGVCAETQRRASDTFYSSIYLICQRQLSSAWRDSGSMS